MSRESGPGTTRSAPMEMTTMNRQFFYTVGALVIFSGFGHALPPEYNSVGRDMYGNTAVQNEAIRLRGTEEKARFAQQSNSTEIAENTARLRSLIPGAVFLTILVVAGAIIYRTRQ